MGGMVSQSQILRFQNQKSQIIHYRSQIADQSPCPLKAGEAFTLKFGLHWLMHKTATHVLCCYASLAPNPMRPSFQCGCQVYYLLSVLCALNKISKSVNLKIRNQRSIGFYSYPAQLGCNESLCGLNIDRFMSLEHL